MHLRYLDCWNWNLETGFHAFVIFRFSQFYSYWFLKADVCQTTPTQHITFAFAETKRWQLLTTYHHHELLSIQIIIRFEENVKNKHSSHRLSQNAIEAIYLNMKKRLKCDAKLNTCIRESPYSWADDFFLPKWLSDLSAFGKKVYWHFCQEQTDWTA